MNRFSTPINPPHSQFYKNLVRRPAHMTGSSRKVCQHAFLKNGRCPDCGECFPVEIKVDKTD